MSETFWWDAEIDDAIFIIATHLSGSPPPHQRSPEARAREHQNQARERGLAGGELVAVVQLPINLSHT